jgi:hypothetical protein
MKTLRLTAKDKQQIVELYRQPGETSLTLAQRFGVSNSTISRVLKQGLSEAEYEELIQQKRGRGSSESLETGIPETGIPEAALVAGIDSFEDGFDSTAIAPADAHADDLLGGDSAGDRSAEERPERSPFRRNQRRRRRAGKEDLPVQVAGLASSGLASMEDEPEEGPMNAGLDDEGLDEQEAESESIEMLTAAAHALESLLDEDFSSSSLNGDLEGFVDLGPSEDELEDEDDDFLPEDEDDEDDEDDDEFEGEGDFLLGVGAAQLKVEVLPIHEDAIPRTCYFVVDRAGELIVRPLKEFGELGQIPESETLATTLPVFDNHRVAKRFANPRVHRVIKLPNGEILKKTTPHLQAKGITRLLIDGRIYSL